MATTGTFTFELRRGTAADWTEENPILHPAEPGVELDTGKMKIGDGINDWVHLPYYPPLSLSVAGVATVDGRSGVVTLGDLYAALAHAHAQSDVTGLVAALAAKAATSHAHAESDVTGLASDLSGKAATVHSHTESDVTGLATDLSNLTTSIAGKAATVHSHAESDVTGLASDLSGKAATIHSHAESDVTGLASDLAGKAATSHTHAASDTTSGLFASARIPRAITPSTLTDASTIATDASLSNHFRVTLGGNRTLGNPTNMVDGQKVIWEIAQDSSGSRTLTLGSAFIFGADITSVVLSTASGKTDFLGAVYNSTLTKWMVIAFTKGF